MVAQATTLLRLQHLWRALVATVLTLSWHFILRWCWSPAVVFIVYGSHAMHRSYSPKWLEGFAKFIRILPVICVIRTGHHWGIVVGVYDSIEDMEADPKVVVRLHRDLVKRFPKSTIAFAGRLPSLLHRGGVAISPPAVIGSLGTRYAMRRVAIALAEHHGRPAKELTIAILGGGGYLGAQITRDLAACFARVIAFDSRYEEEEEEGNVLRTSDPASLTAANVSMIFTPKGDDVSHLVPHLTRGCIVGDDTHPCVSAHVRDRFASAGVVLLKVAASSRQPLRILPKLPNFRSDSVPGCLLEALVVNDSGHSVTADFEEFCVRAEALGFGPQLIDTLDEPLVDGMEVDSSEEVNQH
eukprot:TRINITY_DN63631_c0_g1_i1.p1 TRINITY_DN63631_c0_g1~~TRINITY_DN63631_c0_g1_i1.p1  ORF type:complete len:379 (-),score=63.06 TRINITY_DN63631_c0_g1_i1:150-1214(-)